MVEFRFILGGTEEELQQLIDLYCDAGWWKPGCRNTIHVQKMIQGSHCFLIAILDHQIIGTGRAISDGGSDAYIQDLTVKQSLRHHDIGTRIVKKIIEHLLQQGIEWIGLIAEKNTQVFYEKIGFYIIDQAVPMIFRAESL
ncbi:MAG: GNAT family N-acetyltransferase [Desulfobacterales bacterium]|nr:GNAT family N-acetyltransferase [Desulfobacterales bacterium]